ncbi:YqhV family protein [Cytobacillus sp. FJAT-54145]|uniref:YqhV family protein n=1 Tax=Cytobacillus spartinae TaxID=3299023 RepID=A0ABW6KBA5_9BACI
MFNLFEKAIIGMALLRFLSGSIEVIAAILILKVNQVDKALMINSSLALIGPLILIATTTIGLVGIAEKVSFTKLLWIFCGVGCILYGVKSS